MTRGARVIGRQALRYIAVCLAAGVVATLLVAWGFALIDDLDGVAAVSGESLNQDVRWSVQVERTATGTRITSERRRGLDWGASQATGKPDTPRSGDIVTAWASASGTATTSRV